MGWQWVKKASRSYGVTWRFLGFDSECRPSWQMVREDVQLPNQNGSSVSRECDGGRIIGFGTYKGLRKVLLIPLGMGFTLGSSFRFYDSSTLLHLLIIKMDCSFLEAGLLIAMALSLPQTSRNTFSSHRWDELNQLMKLTKSPGK